MSPVCILIGALGGEGGGVLAQWLVDAAAAAGYPAQSTSIPGVAQRTGATTYYVEIFPQTEAALSGRQPVFSLYPVPGDVDLVISSELLECGRIVAGGMVSPDRTTVVTSTSRTLTTAEKMALGDGRFDSERLLAAARRFSRRLVAFDMEGAARKAGTVVSAVMFGAAAGSGLLPFGREICEAAIREDGRGADASLAGFARGFDAVQRESPRAEAAAAVPAPAREVVALGHARAVEFQDRAYGELYLERVERVQRVEQVSDPSGAHGAALTREAARFLALWMAFDDVVRVAQLKSAASRFARVRRELGAGEVDLVRVYDHFKPGVPELAGILPPAWARRLVAWDRARPSPAGLAIKLRTDTLTGFLALRLLAACKRLRRRGARYALEQAAIESWLGAIERAPDWASAYELALAGRLVKGYGATNERGKRNLMHIVEHLTAAGAGAIRAAREAALADEGGKALDRALADLGAPPRPVAAQPVRFVRRTG
jgi:indolepyruvate ferredoxin oxidoreductase beta subunit